MTTTTTKTPSPSAPSIAQAKVPSLQATAAVLLPGMRHARSLLEISIRVLEYFQRHAMNESATGKFSAPFAVDPGLVAEVQQIKSLLRAFGRLHDNSGDKNH